MRDATFPHALPWEDLIKALIGKWQGLIGDHFHLG